MRDRRAALIVFFLIIILLTQSALAVPAFARRYKFSCTTCHSPFPRLKAYGDEFAGNGFMIPEEEKARDYISAGDDMLWLNKTFPVAVRFDAFAMLKTRGNVKGDLQSPFGIKLLSGGALYKNIGYYFYFYMYEKGEIAGLEDAYIHFNNIFGSNLDILAGQFQTCDPLMKRELRLSYEDYQIFKTRIGNSIINLSYDRGVVLVYNVDQTGTDIVLTATNGNGIGEADATFDQDKYKNVMLRVAQGIGQNVRIGGFYYLGREQPEDSLYSNKATFLGPDLYLTLGKFAFTGQYVLRKDTNPFFRAADSNVATSGIVAELVFSPQLDQSKAYYTLLYNRIDSDLDAHDYQSVALNGSYLLARNLRLVGELIYDLENEESIFVVGFVTAF